MLKRAKQALPWKTIGKGLGGLTIIASILTLIEFLSKFSITTLITRVNDICINILFLKIPMWSLLLLVLVAILGYKIKTRKLNEEQKFILSIIDKREVGLTDIVLAYKMCYQAEPRTKTKCFRILDKLERLKLIKLKCLTGGIRSVKEEIFALTDRGKKRVRKVEMGIRDKAEEIFGKIYYEKHGLVYVDEEIEENKKEIGFILGALSKKENGKELKSALGKDYLETFKNKAMADFDHIWNILEKNKLVEQDRGTTGYGGSYEELPYYITDRGLKLYNDVLKD